MREELFSEEYDIQQTEDQVLVSSLSAGNLAFTAAKLFTELILLQILQLCWIDMQNFSIKYKWY